MKIFGVLLLSAAALGVVVSLFRTGAVGDGAVCQRPAPYESPATNRRVIRALGYVEPVSEVRRLVFKRDGVIAKCSVNVGNRAAAGDILMALASDEEEARLAVAQRELQLAQAEREQLRAGINEYRIAAGDGDYMECYGLRCLSREALSTCSITTRLMVRRDFRASLLATRLARATYESGLRDGITTDFCDCNAHLVPYFQGLGYIPHRTNIEHPEYGAVTVMRLDLQDSEHLRAVRSPFYKTLCLQRKRVDRVVAERVNNI